jgi:6-pyruvoyltetrahydropterin/6-carboxytetrahydropterin synthase
MMFEDGSREPLHGHNYRVMIKGDAPDLNDDMVFDFLDIKPIVREVCDSLDHKLIIPKENKHLKIFTEGSQVNIETKDSKFSVPSEDVLLLPIENSSSERIAIYINQQIRELTAKRFNFEFSKLEVEVEETPGQSAIYVYQKELS